MTTQAGIIIRISRYRCADGLNRITHCFTKREAIEELRDRGMKRDDARLVVKEVLDPKVGHLVAHHEYLTDLIEVCNLD